MKVRTAIRKGDSVTVEPEGEVGLVQSIWSGPGGRFASVRLTHRDILQKVPIKMCKRAHVQPVEKPQEPLRTYFLRAINRDSGVVLREGPKMTTRAEVERNIRSMFRWFPANVDIQIIEHTERVCSVKSGGYRPGL